MDSIIQYYSQFDEWGRLDREPLEFRLNLRYIRRYLPQGAKLLDNGAGPGKYAMRLAQEGHRMTLTDLTPRLVDEARKQAEAAELSDRFDGFYVRDARHLDGMADDSFDGVLMLGPLYHLQKAEDREQAVREAYRVTKRGGFVFAAMMPRTAFAITCMRYPAAWRPNDSADRIAELMGTGVFDHADEGRFTGVYYFRTEEIAPFMESFGFETVQLIGSESISRMLDASHWQYWRDSGPEEAAKLQQVIDRMAEDPALLGISTHVLYIGRKK